ncbi:MAG: hypothetical protein E5W76_15855 [Mesorhizobium sp.]|nr:MAG: hypothetical protein E5W76_15855 [Mesorhizobium sp.]
MPVKRRVDKRHAEALPAWSGVFLSGYDYFENLEPIGVRVDAYGRPEREEARKAWRDFGDLFLATHDGEVEPWALAEFGLPNGRRRHAG